MAIVGTARPPTPGASPAPYITAWVYARYPRADAQRHVTVSFMVDTGADRTVLSLRKARQLIRDDWETVCRTSITAEGIGGAQAYWEVPMRIWFWDASVRSHVYVEPLVLVPFYSEVQDLAELHSERQGREPISLLGRDVFGAACVSNSTSPSLSQSSCARDGKSSGPHRSLSVSLEETCAQPPPPPRSW